jgi:hypothetical protein
LRFWDLFSGGALLHQISSHQKTITSVAVHSMDGAFAGGAVRVTSASLDGHVKASTHGPACP